MESTKTTFQADNLDPEKSLVENILIFLLDVLPINLYTRSIVTDSVIKKNFLLGHLKIPRVKRVLLS